MSSDLLDINYINSLPQPLTARKYGDKYFMGVFDIEVQTGLVRIDVCGLLDINHISDFQEFRDDCGRVYHSDDFYADPECWIDRNTTVAAE